MYQQFREVLYHGTVSKIARVDVKKGRDRKDFGKGFYIAVSRSQAVGMMHKKQREAVRRDRNKNRGIVKEYLYKVTLDIEYAKELDVRVFEQADEEWLDFILMCREKGGIPHKHDVAYAHFMAMELYQLLMDTDSGMYLEPNEYLFECCEIEESRGVDALYDFIKIA